jgi:hypothetical protein
MGTRRFVVLAATACLLLRFPSLLWPMGPDEAGYVLVARHWAPSADSLYGFYFVDRPPLLIGLYSLADTLGTPYLPRLVAALAAVATTLVAGRTGFLIGGSSAARWSAVAAVALTCNPMLGSYQAKGEILALPFLLGSCCLSLEAMRVRRASRTILLAAGAGATGIAALGFKQTLAGGLVFLLALVVAASLTGRCSGRQAAAFASGALVGAAAPVMGLLGWTALYGVEPATVWHTLYTFREDAISAISSRSLGSVAGRVSLLAVYFVASGIGIVLAGFALRLRTLWAELPHVTVAVTALAAADLVPIILGGAYWSSYLVPLLVATILAVGLLTGRVRRFAVPVTAAAAVAALVGFTVLVGSGIAAPTRHYVGEAIGQAARPGDTMVSVYGSPDLVQSSGLDTPYPYLWSLPVRVLDPELRRLRGLLGGPQRPTWVAQPLPLNSWKLDDKERLRSVLEANYRSLGELCGIRVWLRNDVRRSAWPPVDCHRPFLLARVAAVANGG